jgi:hypothetical protein
VPIIRYYDHLRLVYEVQSGIRELRGNEDETPQTNPSQPAGSGQSKKKDGGSRVEPPHHSTEPEQAHGRGFGGYVDASFRQGNVRASEQEDREQQVWEQENRELGNRKMMLTIRAFRRLQGTAGSKASERSRVWTA